MSATEPNRRSRVLWLLVLVCLAPVVASYLAYYVFQPQGRSNYGELIEPQRAVSTVAATTLEGQATTVAALQGAWVMVQVAPARCDEACKKRLWVMRQVRATTGKERDRVQRLWLITDTDAPTPEVLRDFEGTVLWRMRAADLQALFAQDASTATEHLWMIDPRGNLMMRWPREVDPNRMKKDVERLLRASRIG